MTRVSLARLVAQSQTTPGSMSSYWLTMTSGGDTMSGRITMAILFNHWKISLMHLCNQDILEVESTKYLTC